MNPFLLGLLFIALPFSSFGQTVMERQHAIFLKNLEVSKVDSIYNARLKTTEKAGSYKYQQALIYRNKYGWALGKIEQLKKDIPLILVGSYAGEMGYNMVFNPHRFMPSEWERFYEIAVALEKSFDPTSIEYREILGVKTKLALSLGNDKALLQDLPKLIKVLDAGGQHFVEKLYQYGHLLIQNNEREKGIKVLEKGLELNYDDLFLESLVFLYADNHEYDKVLSYENQVLKDTTYMLFYSLGEAYLDQGNKKRASYYFDSYNSIFQFRTKPPFVVAAADDYTFHINPMQLKNLGDFYAQENKNKACKFYTYAVKTIEDRSSRLSSLKRRQEFLLNEDKKAIQYQEFVQYEKELQELLVVLEEKVAMCESEE